MTGYIGSIETETLMNDSFRQVLVTGRHAQLVVMWLQPGEEIGKDMHPDVDQFFRIEQREAHFVITTSAMRRRRQCGRCRRSILRRTIRPEQCAQDQSRRGGG